MPEVEKNTFAHGTVPRCMRAFGDDMEGIFGPFGYRQADIGARIVPSRNTLRHIGIP